MSSRPTTGVAAIGLAGAGVLLGAGGMLHPRVDTSVAYEEGLAGMFESSGWVAAHSLSLAGFVLLAVSLTLLVRDLGPAWSRGQRLLGWAAAGAACLAAVESVPHLLAASESDALLAGESTPLTDLHSLLQAIATPAVGLSVASLAAATARSRTLGSGRIAAALALVGGVAFGAAGPVIALTENSELSALFIGSAGLSIWFLASGVRAARRLGRGAIDRELATEAAG